MSGTIGTETGTIEGRLEVARLDAAGRIYPSASMLAMSARVAEVNRTSPDVRVVVSLPEVPPAVRFANLFSARGLDGDRTVQEEDGPLDLSKKA